MEIVGIRNFKNRLSELVQRARKGERIGISHHGELIAELRSPEPESDSDIPPGLRELALRGTARRVVRNNPANYKTYKPALASTTARELRGWDNED